MCQSLHVDLGLRGVTVQAVCPGYVKTPLTDTNDYAMPSLLELDDAVQRICDGFERKGFEIAFPRHMAYLVKTLNMLPRPLYFALMDLIGGASFALGMLGLYLTWGPLRAGARFAMTALGVCYAIPLVMAAIVAERLAHLTGAPTSWHIMGVLLAIVAAACIAHALARSPRFAAAPMVMQSGV